MPFREIKRNPLILTTRKYRDVVDRLEATQRELDDHLTNDGPFIPVAREIRRQAVEAADTPGGQEAAMELAMGWARDKYKREVIEGYARQKRIELEEADKARIKQEFLATDAARIEQEAARRVAAEEEARRRDVASRTEQELSRLKRDEFLARIDTDEARQVTRRFGEIAVKKAEQEALIEELKTNAKLTRNVELADLPEHTVLKVGLGEPKNQGQSRSRTSTVVDACDRVLTLRVIDPAEGLLETMDDSWVEHTDPVRRRSAIDDLTVLSMPSTANGRSKPRFSRDVEPILTLENGKQLELHGLEVQALSLGDEVVLEKPTSRLW